MIQNPQMMKTTKLRMEKKMNKKHMIKRINKYIAGVLISCMFLTLLGCTGGDSKDVYTEEFASATTALKVGDADISVAEAVINLIINYKSFGITPDNMLTDGKSATELALSNIREYNIMYQKAVEEGYTATPGDVESINKVTDSFMTQYDSILKTYGITRENVHDVFNKQLIYNNYTNDKRVDLGKRMYEGYLEALKDKRFVEMYQITFPLVEVDSEGNIKTDDAGNASTLSDADKADVKANAEKALTDLESGKKHEDVAKDYKVEAYSDVLNGYIGGFSDEINSAIENLENDEYTDILETDNAYIILYMTNNNDETTKAAYAMGLARDNLDEKFESEKQSILSDADISKEDLLEWNNIDTTLLAKKLAEIK